MHVQILGKNQGKLKAKELFVKLSNNNIIDNFGYFRAESGHTEEIVKPFDWTFSTDYQGSLQGNWIIEETNQKIDVNKLRQKEKIEFYIDLTLFEDELHDNGIASLSVKIVS